MVDAKQVQIISLLNTNVPIDAAAMAEHEVWNKLRKWAFFVVTHDKYHVCFVNVVLVSSFFVLCSLAFLGRCVSPADPGPCNATLKRYAYNPYLASCVKFNFSGCGGNSNRFVSEFECEHVCNGKSGNEDAGSVVLRYNLRPM